MKNDKKIVNASINYENFIILEKFEKIKYQTVNNLKISSELLTFVNDELLDGTDISKKNFGLDLIRLYMSWLRKINLIKIRKTCKKKSMLGILKIKVKK